jgi:hypothetical protein
MASWRTFDEPIVGLLKMGLKTGGKWLPAHHISKANGVQSHFFLKLACLSARELSKHDPQVERPRALWATVGFTLQSAGPQ